MNVYSLLENKLEELPTIREHIAKNEYEKLYEQYADTINDLLFLKQKRNLWILLMKKKSK